ncbi:MAG: hypothetical protein LW857_04450 [Verrucomicrobiae bacterium]|nr:hypothetical protein [Verrucomicrobiae bacterium]
MLAELMAFREEPAPREPSEPLGQDAAFHRDREFLAGLRPQADAFVAEAIRLHPVAVPAHREPSLLAHQLGQVEGDQPRVVRNEANAMHRAELDAGHRGQQGEERAHGPTLRGFSGASSVG